MLKFRPVAQLVEWRSPKPQVGGSKPSWPANTQIVNMNSDIEHQEKNSFGLLAWIGIVMITLASFAGAYYFKFSAPIQAIMWIGWIVLSFGLLYLTEEGKKIYSFALEAKIELQKVVWPDRKETINTTTIVMAMVAITGFVLWAVDVSMMWVIGKITHLG